MNKNTPINNLVAKHDHNKGGFHREKTKKDKLLNRKQQKRDIKKALNTGLFSLRLIHHMSI